MGRARHQLTTAALFCSGAIVVAVYTAGAAALWLYARITRKGTP